MSSNGIGRSTRESIFDRCKKIISGEISSDRRQDRVIDGRPGMSAGTLLNVHVRSVSSRLGHMPGWNMEALVEGQGRGACLAKGTRGSGSCWLGAVAGSVGVRGVEATRCRLVDESIGRSDPSCRLTRFPGQARYLASAAWTLLIPKYDSLDLGLAKGCRTQIVL